MNYVGLTEIETCLLPLGLTLELLSLSEESLPTQVSLSSRQTLIPLLFKCFIATTTNFVTIIFWPKGIVLSL